MRGVLRESCRIGTVSTYLTDTYLLEDHNGLEG